MSFLKTKQTKIVTSEGKPVTLKGVNLGGWLMMEGYIMHAPNHPVRKFKKEFAATLGEAALCRFEKSFRDNFIRPKDIQTIARLGLNCIRVPFHYLLIEKKPYRYEQGGVKYLDSVIGWAKKNRIWVILDLHGAAGSQNCDWHSDSGGTAGLWKNKSYQKRTFALWEFLADRYKDNETVAGYDLLNEAVVRNPAALNRFYKSVIKTIRGVDRNHILFIEGNNWSMDLDCLDEFNDDNVVVSPHFYLPMEFTFNLLSHLKYPFKTKKGKWDRSCTKSYLEKYKKLSQKRKVPVLVGEFGVNYREGKYGEDRWLKDTVSCFKEFGFNWTYWTYKAVKNTHFPDGVFSYRDNPAWVNRQGPLTGWDTYRHLWPKRKNEIIASWRSENFEPNTKILNILKNAAR